MTLEILKYPDPRLLKRSVEVKDFGPRLHQLLDTMAGAMYAAKGIGLAAPQVGVLERFFIVDLALQEGFPAKKYEFVNPRIRQKSGSIRYEEGCLSVPGINESVSRAEHILVEFFDRFGQPQELEFSGLLAVAVQHENDHLDGIVFLDRLPSIRKHLAKRRYKKVNS